MRIFYQKSRGNVSWVVMLSFSFLLAKCVGVMKDMCNITYFKFNDVFSNESLSQGLSFIFEKNDRFFLHLICSSYQNFFNSKIFKIIFSKNQTQETSLMYEAKMRATEKKQNNELGDFLKIGDDIAIQIISANDGVAHLGISAPRNKKIKKQQQKICRSEKTF